MNEDLKGRALRAAAAVLAETGIVTPYYLHEKMVSTVAAAWLDGYTAGTADALAVMGATAGMGEVVTARLESGDVPEEVTA